MLNGKKILLGVSASIAAYKAAFLIRLFIKEGAEVKVILTESAKDFVKYYSNDDINSFLKSYLFAMNRLLGIIDSPFMLIVIMY